jgi:hypothetical protein
MFVLRRFGGSALNQSSILLTACCCFAHTTVHNCDCMRRCIRRECNLGIAYMCNHRSLVISRQWQALQSSCGQHGRQQQGGRARSKKCKLSDCRASGQPSVCGVCILSVPLPSAICLW